MDIMLWNRVGTASKTNLNLRKVVIICRFDANGNLKHALDGNIKQFLHVPLRAKMLG